MELIADRIPGNVELVIRKAALAIDQVAVLATPVDTGRARANWIVNPGEPTEAAPNPPAGAARRDGGSSTANGAAAANTAIQQALGAIGSYRLAQGKIWISNNVPYILKLDSGKGSLQAPAGMTAAALAAGQLVLDKARILL